MISRWFHVKSIIFWIDNNCKRLRTISSDFNSDFDVYNIVVIGISIVKSPFFMLSWLHDRGQPLALKSWEMGLKVQIKVKKKHSQFLSGLSTWPYPYLNNAFSPRITDSAVQSPPLTSQTHQFSTRSTTATPSRNKRVYTLISPLPQKPSTTATRYSPPEFRHLGKARKETKRGTLYPSVSKRAPTLSLSSMMKKGQRRRYRRRGSGEGGTNLYTPRRRHHYHHHRSLHPRLCPWAGPKKSRERAGSRLPRRSSSSLVGIAETRASHTRPLRLTACSTLFFFLAVSRPQ